METLTYFRDAPPDVQARIRRAEQLVLEALADYEPYFEKQVAKLRADPFAESGEYMDEKAIKDSPFAGISGNRTNRDWRNQED